MTLTVQEVQAAYLSRYDLGPGYPQVHLPAELEAIYRDDDHATLGLLASGVWNLNRQNALDFELEESVCSFLSIDKRDVSSVEATYSGSVALDRAIAAATELVSPSRSEVVDVIATSPSIDIMRLFLDERRHLNVLFVESRARQPWGLDREAILTGVRRVQRTVGRRGLIVILSSPENPTGQFWSTEDLRLIYESVSAAGGILIVDHAFLTAGVQGLDSVPGIWTAVGAGDWIALWDTGKTFGLSEEKMGFLLAGSDRVHNAVKTSLSIVQFGVSRRQRSMFAALLRYGLQGSVQHNLRAICERNLSAASEILAAGDLTLITPDSGSVALVSLPSRFSDEVARKRLLESGVGVVAGRAFFHTDWVRTDLLRISLARETAYFREGMLELARILSGAPGGGQYAGE